MSTQYERREIMHRLVDLRLAQGLSQEEVAALMSIAQPAVSQFENSTDPYFSTMQRYAQALGYKIQVDFTRTE